MNQLYALQHPRWEDFDYTYLDELEGNPMSWLGNGYTVADYDGSSRTAYLDPTMIDYPPVPEPQLGKDKVAAPPLQINGVHKVAGGVVITDRAVPETAV